MVGDEKMITADGTKLIVVKSSEEIREENLQRLAGFRIMDDTFARSVFKENPKLAEFVLKIITKLEDLEIDPEGYETQFDAKRLAGSRSLVLDVHGGDTKGRKFDFEVEKWDASPERAEYHVATMFIEHLRANQPFSELPETYVIFMCEHDVVGNGRAVNQFTFRNDDLFLADEATEKLIQPHESMKGKAHILFVNGDYKDNQSDIGKLIHDFKCSKPRDMFYENLAGRARYLKDDPKGVEEMCKEMEKVRIEGEQVGLLKAILSTMKTQGWDVEKTMSIIGIKEEERPLYAASAKYAMTRQGSEVAN